jgi:uncharacterized protein YndB with AHSA1/START domain
MTNATIMPAPIRKSITVNCPPARAFAVFAERMGAWWLPSHSIAASGLADVVIEPQAGGRWYEIGKAGEECDWGRVEVYDPPVRLLLIWQLTAEFTHDPGLYTEVDVTFAAEGGGTQVVLEHRRLENYRAAADSMRGVFDSPNGWGGLLVPYAAAAGV